MNAVRFHAAKDIRVDSIGTASTARMGEAEASILRHLWKVSFSRLFKR